MVALLEVWKDNRTDDIPVSSDCIHIVACKLPIGKWSGEFKKRERERKGFVIILNCYIIATTQNTHS